VMTVMDNLHRKGWLRRERDGRAWRYEPTGSRSGYTAALMNEAEWAARSNSRRDQLYTRLKQARAFATPAAGLDRAAAQVMLTKVERLMPGLLDFVAFLVAQRIIRENRDDDLLAELSVVKCRAVFDAAPPEVRATLLAGVLGASVKPLIDAGRLGDNLMRAMLEQGLAAHRADFESFGERRRR